MSEVYKEFELFDPLVCRGLHDLFLDEFFNDVTGMDINGDDGGDFGMDFSSEVLPHPCNQLLDSCLDLLEVLFHGRLRTRLEVGESVVSFLCENDLSSNQCKLGTVVIKPFVTWKLQVPLICCVFCPNKFFLES